MLKLAVFLALAALVSSAPVDPSSICVPDQFHSLIFTDTVFFDAQSGRTTLTTQYGDMWYNYDVSVLRTDVDLFVDEHFIANISVVSNYLTRKVYEITNRTSCKVSNMDDYEELPRCLDPGTKYVDQLFLAGAVALDLYTYEDADIGGKTDYIMAHGSNAVHQIIAERSSKQSRSMYKQTYADWDGSPLDSDIFVIPEECFKSPEAGPRNPLVKTMML
eukprot:TRINITY_DN21471_c0_g1_i1.p1 TRINITY_DN21471_c0_g1~~TRINITY_DN21471_c0_g1_i1.p1  ORF type:complete len:218 (-),score=67.24 TRINITY_DN21471_c0_g1_i1:77-730(-)